MQKQKYQEWREWKENYLAEKILCEARGSPTKKMKKMLGDHAIGRVCEDYPCCGHDSPSECRRANR